MVSKKVLFIGLLLLSRFSSFSQTTASGFLEEAIAACGSWPQLQNVYFTTERTNVNKWQAYSFTEPKPTRNQFKIYLDLTEGRLHNHSTFNSPGGYVFEFVNISKDSSRFVYDKNMARNGKALLKQGKDLYVSSITQAKQSFPYFILQTIKDSNDSLQYSVVGNNTTLKRFAKDGSTTDYVFDNETKLLRKIARKAGAQNTERFFNKYTSMEGYSLPVLNQLRVDGNLTSSDSLMSFKTNVSIPPSAFEIPAQYTIPTQSPAKALTAQEISKDVFLISGVGGDRNVVFINMNDYVVVTEAPLSPDVVKSVIAVIHKTLPGKAIRYVHLSHFHNDHSVGIRQYVSEGAAVIATAEQEAPIRGILNNELGVFKDDYAAKPIAPKFELFSKVKVLEDKDHRIEFHEVQNSHALGLSFLYLPKEKIIYEGDLLSVPEDGTLTPAIPVTREFQAYLKKNKIKWSRIIGHHGHASITPSMFKEMLSRKK